MDSPTTLIKGARLIVETCMTVRPGDRVLIIADGDHKQIAETLSGVAYSLGAWPIIADVTPQVVACLASLKVPMEPPAHLAAAMVNSDEIIITTNLEWANRFAHVNPVGEAVRRGAKVASVEEGIATWEMTIDDIAATTHRAECLIDALAGAKWVHVTSPAGSDLKICIEKRPPLKVVPIKEPGIMMGPIPLWGEVAYAAIEDRTEGIMVYDGVMLGVGAATTLKTPIRLVIEKGRAVEITGGEEAERLREAIAGSDENANVVAEFAIGTSHLSKFGSPSEKGKLGTIHFGLGDNHHCYPCGQSVSRTHLDGTLRDVSLEVEGRYLIKDGKLLV